MLVNLAVGLTGLLTFLFIFWRRLKEDYAAEIIFRTATYIMLGLLLAVVPVLRYLPNWYWFAALVGVFAGLSFASYKMRIRFYEALEAMVAGFLPWFAFMFLGDSVVGASLTSFLGFVGVLFLIFVFYYLDSHYKEYSWYKSGKVGFVGLSTLGLIFLIRSVVAIFDVTMLSFVGKSEALVSGTLAFLSFLMLFNLARE